MTIRAGQLAKASARAVLRVLEYSFICRDKANPVRHMWHFLDVHLEYTTVPGHVALWFYSVGGNRGAQ